jgi:hypothetical protein
MEYCTQKIELPLANPGFSCTIVSDSLWLLADGGSGFFVTEDSNTFNK